MVDQIFQSKNELRSRTGDTHHEHSVMSFRTFAVYIKLGICMKAWLLTWEGTDPAITDGRKLIAILNGRRASSFIQDVAEMLYLRNYGTAHEMTYLANRKGEKFYGCMQTWNGGFLIRNNPFVYGRQVSDLKVQRDTNSNTEKVSWKEPPSYRQVPERNYAVEQVDPGEYRSLVRSATATVANDLGRTNV